MQEMRLHHVMRHLVRAYLAVLMRVAGQRSVWCLESWDGSAMPGSGLYGGLTEHALFFFLPFAPRFRTRIMTVSYCMLVLLYTNRSHR